MTTAQTVAAKFSKMNMTAVAALEVILNATLPEVSKVSIHHCEITFKDGSLVILHDTINARSIGLTNYDYAIRTQDAAC